MARAEFTLGPRFARTRGRATQTMKDSPPAIQSVIAKKQWRRGFLHGAIFNVWAKS